MVDENATKKLSPVIGKEEWFKLDKCSIKFMKTGKTYSTKQNPQSIFTIKPIKEVGLNEQIQLHIRVPINDYGEDMGLLDVDFYVDKNEWELKTNEKPQIKYALGKPNQTTL